MRMQRKAVTLEDIAERLGTSKNTVSRALRDCTDIGAEMKEKVKQTAAEMGYVPNKIAGFLRFKRSNIIAVVISSMTNPFFSVCMDYCADYMAEKGYRPLISLVRGTLDVSHIISCIQNGACGILTFMDVSREGVDYCEQNKIPLLACGLKPQEDRVSAIYSDDYRGSQLVAQQAIKNGAKRPCYVGGSKNWNYDGRQESFRVALKSAGLECDLYSYNYYGKEKSLEKIRQGVLENGNDFIFCFNDEIAAGVQEVMEKTDYRGDIYGVDRFSEYLPYCRKIKSVGGKLSTIGKRSAQLLIRKIEKYDGKVIREIFPVELNTLEPQ